VLAGGWIDLQHCPTLQPPRTPVDERPRRTPKLAVKQGRPADKPTAGAPTGGGALALLQKYGR